MCTVFYINLFYFSSRRRHTRWPRDWSSDVCSSDLGKKRPLTIQERFANYDFDQSNEELKEAMKEADTGENKIGRASCREREKMWEEAGSVKKQKKREEREKT